MFPCMVTGGNPFERYFPDQQCDNDVITANKPNELESFIILVTGAFENKCIEIDDNLDKLTTSISRCSMNSKFEKRRKFIYGMLDNLENLRKTMVRAQQMHQSHVNQMQKENYMIRRILTKKTIGQADQVRIIERNIRTIEHAKHCSREITRTVIMKNIFPLKLKLEDALEDFVLFAEMIIDMKIRELDEDGQ